MDESPNIDPTDPGNWSHPDYEAIEACMADMGPEPIAVPVNQPGFTADKVKALADAGVENVMKPEVLGWLNVLKAQDMGAYVVLRRELKARKVPITMMEKGMNAVARKRPAETSDASWMCGLLLGNNGVPQPLLENAAVALEHAPEWKGAIAWNEFTNRAILVRPVPHTPAEGFEPRQWKDCDDISLARWLQRNGIATSPETAGKAVQEVAQQFRFHPVQDYLNGLEWDGTPRLEGFLHVCLGVEDTPYSRAVSKAFLISAVARIMRPGSKVDTMLVIEGPQGKGKSQAVEALFGSEYYCDTLPDIHDKDAMVQLFGRWCIEVSEMTSLKRGEVTAVKAFVSRTKDSFRLPFGHRSEDFPRSCVFCATTNETDWNKDETGARRYWPVRAGVTHEIDIAKIKRRRNDIWAEAVKCWRDGEPWWFTDEATKLLVIEEQEDRFDNDSWHNDVAQWLADEKANEITMGRIAQEVLDLSIDKMDKLKQMRLSTILKVMGWTKCRVKRNGVRLIVYVRPGHQPAAE